MVCRIGRHGDPRAALSFLSVAYATGMSDRQSPTREQYCASVHLRLWALLIRRRIGISTSLSSRQPASPAPRRQTSPEEPPRSPAYCVPDDETTLVDEHVETLRFDDDLELVVIQVYITNGHRSYEIADIHRSRGCTVALGGLPSALSPGRCSKGCAAWDDRSRATPVRSIPRLDRSSTRDSPSRVREVQCEEPSKAKTNRPMASKSL